MTTRKRRTLEERIDDEQKLLAELQAKLDLKKIEEAVHEGVVPEADRAEFRQLKKEVSSIKKVIKAAERHERPQIYNLMNVFRRELTEAMTGLVTSSDDDE